MNTLHILCLLISLYCIVCTEYVINLKEKVNFATIQKNSIPLESLSFEERGNVVYKALRSVAENSQRKVKHILTSLGIPFQSFWISNTIIVKDIDENILELLHQCDDIESIEKVDPISLPPNEISTITENPELKWNIEFISSQKAYEKGYYGQNVVVGVIDSGVTTEHEDLIDKYRGSKDGSHDYNWFDTTSTCEDTPCDDHGIRFFMLIPNKDMEVMSQELFLEVMQNFKWESLQMPPLSHVRDFYQMVKPLLECYWDVFNGCLHLRQQMEQILIQTKDLIL